MQYYFEPLEIPGNPIPERFRNQFEFLFFYLEPNHSLASKKNYSEKYFNFLKDKFSIEPKLVDYDLGDQNYWFFENQDLLLNKIVIHDHLEDLNLWEHEIYIANSRLDIKEGHFLTKNPLGFSGRGVKNLSKKENLTFPILIEEKLNRLKDFSYYHEDQNFIFYENKIGKNYNYLGTQFDQKLMNDFGDWFKAQGISDKEILLFQERKTQLHSRLISLNFERYNVDCFTYLSGNKVKIHIACEVNLRKSMGYLLSKVFKERFSEHQIINFKLEQGVEKLNQESSLGPLGGEDFTITYKFGVD